MAENSEHNTNEDWAFKTEDAYGIAGSAVSILIGLLCMHLEMNGPDQIVFNYELWFACRNKE